MPKHLNSRCKELISSLISYFEKERDNNGPLLPLTAVRERVAAALNLNISTVSTISTSIKKNKLLESPKKKRSHAKRVINVEKLDISSIRDAIYGMYETRLLVCNMIKTAKGILENFVFVSKVNGVIPEKPRIYYSYRPHPPLLTAMVSHYINHTNDIEWLEDNIGYISTELEWWHKYRTHTVNIRGVDYMVARWGTNSFMPRPERLIEDEIACKNEVVAEQEECINNLRSVEETGWSFSSRWTQFGDLDSSNRTDTIQPHRVIPVDLTAILCQAFNLLASFYNTLGDKTNADKWKNLADGLQITLQKLLYNEKDGIWYDFDMELLQQRIRFFAINFTPLWTECYDLTKRDAYGKRAADYYTKHGFKVLWGVPTSESTSGEKWDFPNAFAPMQELVVFGLYKTENNQAQELARNLANKWIMSNVKGWYANKSFHDSYDVTKSGRWGTGGENSTEVGYVWTVGVALTFIDKFACSSSIATAIFNNFFYTIGYSVPMIVGKLLKML